MPSSNEPLTATEEMIAFYYYIGRAITSWAHVESALFWVVSSCFSKSSHQKLDIGFFSIENFRSKLQFADRIFKAKYAQKKHLNEWNRLFKELERHSRTRNHLAHYHVLNYPHGRAGRRCALLPRIANQPTRRQQVPKPPSEALCIRDIIQAQQNFSALAFSVEFLFYRLIRRKTTLSASLAQAKDAPTTAQLTRQIRTMVSRLPSPSQP